MIQYKFEISFNKDIFFYPGLNFIQNSSIETNFDSQDNDDIIEEFVFFFDQFQQIGIINDQYINKSLDILIRMNTRNIEVPVENIFMSSFPLSLIQTVKQLLIKIPKGDRILSPYIWVMSYIICLDNSAFDDELILLLFEIITNYTNFNTTFLHSIVCLNYLLYNEKYDNIILSQIDQILNLAFKLNASQAIVKYSQFLLLLSNKKINLKHLQDIAHIFIHFSTNPKRENDMSGVLNIIDEFISKSNNNLALMVESGLIANLSCILSKASNYQNKQVAINIIEKLSNSQYFNVFLFDTSISNYILSIFCDNICKNIDSFQIKSIDIISRLVNCVNSDKNFKNNVFIPLLNRTVIIDKLFEKMGSASFKLKKSISILLINLIYTRNTNMINKIIKEESIEFLFDQLVGFLDPEILISALKICLEVCTNNNQQKYLTSKLKDAQEFVYVF